MRSIPIRPPEAAERRIPGQWKGGPIKGAGNRSSIGALVERVTGFAAPAKMSGARADDALETIPPHLRKTMTHGQGRKMIYHEAMTRRTRVAVSFADPHAPWRRDGNGNTNRLLRQYLPSSPLRLLRKAEPSASSPKDANLADHTQDELNTIALSLNTKPHERLDSRTPLECYTDLIQLDQMPIGIMQQSRCCTQNQRPPSKKDHFMISGMILLLLQ